MKTRWLPFATYQTKARLRLLCFSHAGGNARVFRRWGEAIPGEVEVCPVELPGRGTRLGEGLVSSMPLLVETMAAEIEPLLDLPFAIFGHSMGGLVGFELARTLRRVYGWEPAALLVAAQNAPSVPLERPTAQRCTDGELSDALYRSGGMSEKALANARFMRVFLPVLRADYTMVDTYVYTRERPLRCPIHLYTGTEDTLVSGRGQAEWRRETSGDFVIHRFPGGHFFLREAQGPFLASIFVLLRELAWAKASPG
ncbi:MAG: putative thioesterase [Actinobacteria bacterium]|nr:MAG: putative thioesterase [Actinomycetota bacterium]